MTNYYLVSGSTFSEIMESIDRARPARLPAPQTGLTEWTISWRFRVAGFPGGCRCDSFTTQTTITNTLPLWRPRAHASPDVKAAWREYFLRLASHEAGHSQIALAALAEVRKQLKQVREEPDFESLKKKINDRLSGVIARYRKLDEDYDARTEHGARPAGQRLPARRPAGAPAE